MTQKTELNWPRLARWAVAVPVAATGCVLVPDDPNDIGPAAVLLLAVTVFWLLKLKARREEVRRIDAAELRTEIGR